MYQPNFHSLSLSRSLSPCPHLCIYVPMRDLSVHPSTHVIHPGSRCNRSIYLSIDLSIYLSVYLSIYLAVIQLSINSLSRSTLHPSIICLYIDLFVYLFSPSICLPI